MKIIFQVQKIILVFFLSFVAIFCLSYLEKSKYPDPKEAFPALENDPVQTQTNAQRFILEDKSVEYEITPLFNYELYGMIVSSGDNLGWFSRFKDKDPLNINDLCVIWGDNVDTGIYKQMSFKNEEFVCKGSFNGDSKDFAKFSNNHLSNNHLLADSKTSQEMYNKIRSAKAGDQIHFKGYLVSYATKKDGIAMGTRGSSTTREDSGDGACETVFVTDFEIIQTYSTTVGMINQFSFDFATYCGIAWIILLLISWLLPNEYQREEEAPVGKTDYFQESLPTNITDDGSNTTKKS